MKKMFAVTLLALSALSGCSYAGVGVTADGHAVIARNDALLYGILRKVYVCRVTPNGLEACASNEAP